MNILVTGGCGFIGSNFINYYLEKEYNGIIVNIDCLNYCADENNVKPYPNYKFIKGNIMSKDLVAHILSEYNIDIVIHFASSSHVCASFDNSVEYTENNVLGTHVLIQCCREYGKIQKFLLFSSDECYGTVDLGHEGCAETSILDPTNPYAASKACQEFICRSYFHSFKMPVITIRCNNVYGLNQYPEKLIPKFITLLRDNKKLTIHGQGITRRNFIWTEDVNTAVSLIMEEGVIGEIYNIGTSQEHSVMEIAETLIKKIKNSENFQDYLEYVPDRPFNDFRYAIDATKLKTLGWKETHTDFSANLDKIIASIIK